MGRDLEEVQWHYSLPDFCLLSVLPASSHTETLFYPPMDTAGVDNTDISFKTR